MFVSLFKSQFLWEWKKLNNCENLSMRYNGYIYFTDAKKKLRLVLSTPTLSLYAGNRIPEMSGRFVLEY